jgi:multiple sugar transport system ATP-binding protein
MAGLQLSHLVKHFECAARAVIDDVSLTIDDGEFVVLLGPSGCGKTTLLRMIAGLEYPNSGDILLDGASQLGRDAAARDIALVFQQYALYPHMTVEQNLLYPLKVTTLTKNERQDRVVWAAELVDIGALLARRPAELSGGEQQRVALARAIVRRPQLFLLDEPLSNLDAQTRVSLRGELRSLQRSLGATTVMVTHDQADAMAVADRIAVMSQGRVEQFGSADDLYERPANMFVAKFMGSPMINMVEATVAPDGLILASGWRLPNPAGLTLPAQVHVGIRPESITLLESPSASCLPVQVTAVEPFGSEVIVHVRAGDLTLRVRCGPRVRPPVGSERWISVSPGSILLFDAQTGTALR